MKSLSLILSALLLTVTACIDTAPAGTSANNGNNGSNGNNGESCAAEESVCDGQCISTDSDPVNCGDCGMVCGDVPNGRQDGCIDGQCQFICNAGFYEHTNGSCVKDEDNNCEEPNTYYVDADNDGWGGEGTISVCGDLPPLHSLKTGDCNDGDATINPGASEACVGVDSDCDGFVDCQDADCFENNAEACPNILFVTTSTYTGDFGGVEAADALCQQEADGALSWDPTIAWKAILSGDGSAADRIEDKRQVQTPDGTSLAKDGELFVTLKSAPSMRVDGGYISDEPNTLVWTGSSNDGSALGLMDCDCWDGGPFIGGVGDALIKEEWLSKAGIVPWSQACSEEARFYCISQPLAD